MQFVLYTLYFVHVIVSIFLILVVLLQQGKGADLAVFGGGSTQAAFGARSATTLLHKLTVGGFVLFIATTLSIAILQTRSHLRTSVVDGAAATTAGTVAGEEPAADSEPAVDAATAPDAADTTGAPAEQPATPTDDGGDGNGGSNDGGDTAPGTEDGGQ